MNESESDDRYLTIRTSVNEGLVELSVVDQGIGINEEVAAQIFEPFFTTKQRGTGMGLALSRTIVRAHGGSIEATSNRQNGATFSFRLPMVASWHMTSKLTFRHGKQKPRACLSLDFVVPRLRESNPVLPKHMQLRITSWLYFDYV